MAPRNRYIWQKWEPKDKACLIGRLHGTLEKPLKSQINTSYLDIYGRNGSPRIRHA